jgi:hypothetical protein
VRHSPNIAFSAFYLPQAKAVATRQPEYDPFLAVLDNFSLNDKIVQ